MVGASVGAGVSEAVRSGQQEDAQVVVSKDYIEYPDYSAKSVWQVVNSELYYDYSQENEEGSRQTSESTDNRY